MFATRAWLIFALFHPLTSALLAVEPKAPDATQKARDILTQFEKGEPYWPGRMVAMSGLVKVGPPAVPVLVEAMTGSKLDTRLFAGEMLALMIEPESANATTRAALEAALENPEDSVREFAIHALNRIGGLEQLKQARHVLEKDPNPGIRRVMAAALKGELCPNTPQIRRALREFNPAQMDSARLRHLAPDFVLPDTTENRVRLSAFRGQKPVVLVFLVEDD
jgi:HEAT repeat protein